MAEILIILISYHALFFHPWYSNVFKNSTGELLSTHFPHWISIGRKWARKDEIYYYEPASIPFLSMFYPPHFLTAKLSKYLNTDNAFRLLHYVILAHYILCSVMTYVMFSQWFDPMISLFGAISITYMGASQRIQNPCIAYTMSWIPGCFIAGPLGDFSLGMAILGGYWPILAYMIPWIAMNNPWALRGIILGLPQIIPFIFYWKRSIRHKQKVDSSFGSVPLWRFFFQDYRGYVNGVNFFESAMGFGIVPILALFSTSRSWIIVAFSAIMALGIIRSPFRCSSRWIYPFSFFMIWMSCSGLSTLNPGYKISMLILISQGFLLLRNSSLYPLWPFCEWQRKPSEWFNKEEYEPNKFPYFTGYFHGRRTKGYTGGFALKETCERNGVTNPNGERV